MFKSGKVAPIELDMKLEQLLLNGSTPFSKKLATKYSSTLETLMELFQPEELNFGLMTLDGKS